MDWNSILGFMEPEVTILVVFLVSIGMFLKRLPGFKKEWLIPIILWCSGIVFTAIWILTTEEIGIGYSVVKGIVQGTISAALAVFGNEIFKQVTVKRKEDMTI